MINAPASPRVLYRSTTTWVRGTRTARDVMQKFLEGATSLFSASYDRHKGKDFRWKLNGAREKIKERSPSTKTKRDRYYFLFLQINSHSFLFFQLKPVLAIRIQKKAYSFIKLPLRSKMGEWLWVPQFLLNERQIFMKITIFRLD